TETYAEIWSHSICSAHLSASPTWRPVLTGSKAPEDSWTSSSRVRDQSSRRPASAQNFQSLTSGPLQGESPTVDLVFGYKKSNQSPILELLCFRDWMNWSLGSRREPVKTPRDATVVSCFRTSSSILGVHEEGEQRIQSNTCH